MAFRAEGDDILLLGASALHGAAAALAGSEYLKELHGGLIAGQPSIDLDLEVRLQRLCLEAARSGLLRSAHDTSRGGLAVTLAECCIESGLGLEASGVGIEGRRDAALFGETSSRIVVSTKQPEELISLAIERDVPVVSLGRVARDRLTLGSEIDVAVSELGRVYEEALPRALTAAD